jgi:hypothetical protein
MLECPASGALAAAEGGESVCRDHWIERNYEPALLTADPTSLNFVEADVPRNVTARRITTAIKATINAYSTAVAPCSSWKRSLRSAHQV